MTQEEFAGRIGISQNHLSTMLSGNSVSAGYGRNSPDSPFRETARSWVGSNVALGSPWDY